MIHSLFPQTLTTVDLGWNEIPSDVERRIKEILENNRQLK
jgi:hypothetical protein